MKRWIALARTALLALLALPLAAAAQPQQIAAAQPQQIVLHGAQTLAPWRVVVSDFEAEAVLGGAAATVPKPAQPRVPASRVGARRDGAALTLHWHDAWYASLRFEGATLDLRPYVGDGTLEFDLHVAELARGGLKFKLACGPGCERKVPFLLAGRELAGRGWQRLSFALSCFVREGDDFGAVTQPFVVETSGSGTVSVANVRFVRDGKAATNCPDYRTQSVTPEMLNESWALEWWLPRHEKKRAEVRALREAGHPPALVFIGDSITGGWEKEGRAVWERHYAPLHAVNLGFGGDRTENVLWRLQHGALDDLSPKVAVLMIGTNNTGDRQEDPRTTAAGVRRLIDEIRTRLPGTTLLLLAVFPRDERPDGVLRRLNERVNAIISGYADGRDVVFLNLNAALSNADGTLAREILPDMLHLSEAGYARWAQAMQPTLQRLLQRP